MAAGGTTATSAVAWGSREGCNFGASGNRHIALASGGAKRVGGQGKAAADNLVLAPVVGPSRKTGTQGLFAKVDDELIEFGVQARETGRRASRSTTCLKDGGLYAFSGPCGICCSGIMTQMALGCRAPCPLL